MIWWKTKIQHAENGREFYIKELGYWVDGYDEINNTVYEWYEKHHFNADEKMREKDIKRINEIKEFLKCRFVGYNWNGDVIIDEH